MTKSEVISLLGEPDTMPHVDDLEYKIKPDWFLDWRVLYLKFSDDKVEQYDTFGVPDW